MPHDYLDKWTAFATNFLAYDFKNTQVHYNQCAYAVNYLNWLQSNWKTNPYIQPLKVLSQKNLASSTLYNFVT